MIPQPHHAAVKQTPGGALGDVPGDAPKPKKQAQDECLKQQLRKTRFCKHFLHKGCHYGDHCNFAHNIVEMVPSPDLTSTRLCKAFAAGGCKDPECKFAHSRNELRAVGMFHKTDLCKWYMVGRCHFGPNCRFAHGVDELDQQPQSQHSSEESEMQSWDVRGGQGTGMREPDGGQGACNWEEPMFVQPGRHHAPLGLPAAPAESNDTLLLGIRGIKLQINSLPAAPTESNDTLLLGIRGIKQQINSLSNQITRLQLHMDQKESIGASYPERIAF